jgi:arabinose-5-phosphate isomerase
MKKRGFSEKDFADVHPRGQAGRKIILVESLMRRGSKIPRVRVTTPMKDAIEEMSIKKIGMTCVLDEKGLLAGVITDGDLRRMVDRFRGSLFKKTAGDCMTPDPITIDKGDLATTALNIMEEKKITSLVIRNKEGKVEGIIHLHDLWRTEMF